MAHFRLIGLALLVKLKYSHNYNIKVKTHKVALNKFWQMAMTCLTQKNTREMKMKTINV